jgi:HlyD family secretion protein
MKKYGKLILGMGIFLIMVVVFFYLRNRNQVTTTDQFQTVKAVRGSLMATIGATGIVRSNQSAVLNWQTSGTVGEINVKLGEFSRKGDTLASILPTSLPQNVILARADLINARKALDTVMISNTSRAQAQLALSNAKKAFADASYTRQALEIGRNNKDAAANAEAQYVIASKNLEAAQASYDRLASLPDDNTSKALAFSALYDAQQVVKSRLNAWNWYKNQASSQDISEADAKLALAQAQLEDAQREWDRVKDGPDQNDVSSAQARVTASQASLNSAYIFAPFNGTITEIKPMVGDQVSPGIPVFRIDDLSRLLVDVQVSEVDINSVQLGQSVNLSFDAILDVNYHGEVVSVAQVGNTNQGAVSFSVTVELTDADDRVKPGMTSAVTVIVNKLDNVLLVPNRAVRLVNNQRVVYILSNGVSKEIKITLGATSGIDSEVLSGDLKQGDLIILNPQSSFSPGGADQPGGGGMFGG